MKRSDFVGDADHVADRKEEQGNLCNKVHGNEYSRTRGNHRGKAVKKQERNGARNRGIGRRRKSKQSAPAAQDSVFHQENR